MSEPDRKITAAEWARLKCPCCEYVFDLKLDADGRLIVRIIRLGTKED